MPDPAEDLAMIAEHMEQGFLENIEDMFKHDPKLFSIIPALLDDERSRVRIGAAALMEALAHKYPAEVEGIMQDLVEGLKSPRLEVRADTAYVLGAINAKGALPALKEALLAETVLPVKHVLEEVMGELEG